jgi:hypothetical protein
MPDQDIVERSLRRPWKRSYRVEKGGHSAEVVAASLIKDLAAAVRDDGGMPGFEQLLPVYFRVSGRPDGARTLAHACRAVEERFEQQWGVKILGRAALRSFALIEARRGLPSRVSLSEEYLRSRVRHDYFAKVTHRLVGRRKRFSDLGEAQRFDAHVWEHLEPQLKKLAVALASDPSARRLRAPKSLLRSRSTEELLETAISIGEP